MKKSITLLIWCLGSFVATASGLGNALGYFVQAKVYNKPNPISLSYSVRRQLTPLQSAKVADWNQVVAATAGIAFGPLFAVALGRRYGRTCIFFWSNVGLLVTGIWSATMTHSNQYGVFVAARLFGGLFGGIALALGAETIVDIFFLHQRGKAFTALNLSWLAGVVVGPTLSGFIVDSTSWTVQFWWSNGLEGVVIILSLALLEDTYYDRTLKSEEFRKRLPNSFVANRMATFFCGSRVIPPISMAKTVSRFQKLSSYNNSRINPAAGNVTLRRSQLLSDVDEILTVGFSSKYSAIVSSLASARSPFSAAALCTSNLASPHSSMLS